ncbi:MAG: murein L,D-transpeptidase catalytic domain family protein [Polymorphobacter sp.]
MTLHAPELNRRRLLGGALFAGAALAVPARAVGANGIDPAIRARALASLSRHRAGIAHTDKLGIVDFSRASREPRFHILDLASGATATYLVAHGRGSDPAHTGWLSRWSNEEGSNASSPGAYATGDFYVGKHGQSMRLQGLDPTNSAAGPRAIVVHAAWYVSPTIVQMTGKLGRSQGCFAFSTTDLKPVLEQLGHGRMIYADKV